jgi:hypothetical protein
MSYAQPQHGGAADSYYQEGQQNSDMQQQQPYQQSYPPQYPQQPPQYGQQPGQPPQVEKQDFDQTFRVDKPKFNDIWAAILFLAVFFGFVAVSGLAIHGYSATKGSQGDGIYNSDAQAVGLNTNTIVLL